MDIFSLFRLIQRVRIIVSPTNIQQNSWLLLTDLTKKNLAKQLIGDFAENL